MSDSSISGQDIIVDTADGPMRLYEAKPPGRARGAIIIVQEAFGVNPHIEDVTRRAAAAGYHAVAPDFFHRSGPGAVVEYGKFDLVMEYFQALGSDDAILTDVDAALAHLRAAGFADKASDSSASASAVGCRSSSHSGARSAPRWVSTAAASSPAASRSSPPWSTRSRRCRRRGSVCSATRTDRFPVEDVEQLRVVLEAASVDTDIVRYAEAGHGFHCDQRPDYRPEDAADAWRRALDWFSQHLS